MKSIFVPKELNKSDTAACIDIQSGASSTDMHWHSCAEIIHMSRGEALVFVAEKWETLKTGDTVFLPPGHLHCCHCKDNQAGRVVIGLEKGLIPTVNSQNDISHIPFYSSVFQNNLIFKDNKELISLFTSLEEMKNKSGIHVELARLITVERIYLEMLTLWENMGLIVSSSIKNTTVIKIQEILSRDFSEELTAKDVAKRLNISYSYMATLLSRELNSSFSELLLSERINAAKRLLLTTDMSITDIALDTGFGDSSYFIKKFRIAAGITPYQYRSLNLKRINT